MVAEEGHMLANNKHKPAVSDYASDRVFDGARPISKARLAKLRANYKRRYTTPTFRIVAQVTRFFGFRTVHGH
jgi:hypothetical protein